MLSLCVYHYLYGFIQFRYLWRLFILARAVDSNSAANVNQPTTANDGRTKTTTVVGSKFERFDLKKFKTCEFHFLKPIQDSVEA